MRGTIEDQRAKWRQVAVGLVASLLYIALFLPLGPVLGAGLASLSSIPVALLGALGGLRVGIVAGLAAIVVNTALLNVTGFNGWGALLQAGGGAGSVAIVVLGAGAGALRDMLVRQRDTARALTEERSVLQQEIAARTRAEGALRASEARLRSVITNLPVAVVAFDRDGLVVLAEGRLFGSLGMNELVGRSVEEIGALHPAAAVNVRQALAGHEFTTIEQLSGRSVETRYAPVRAASGEIVGALSLSAELDERELTQRTLRESEQRFRKMFEDAAIGVGIVGLDFRLQQVNRSLCEMLGYAEAELVGRTVREITHPDDIERDAALSRRVFDGAIPSYRIEKRFLRKDGEAVWASVSAAAIRDDKGRPLYGVCTAENVTERIRVAETLEHLALFDGMTDLPNRTLLHERLSQEIRAARRTGATLGVLVLDLDQFKAVNDAHGHHIGDLCLRQIGPRLREALREIDTIARLGGDEFAVLLPMTDESGAREVARKILAALAHPFEVEERQVLLAGSIGIAAYPRDGDEPDHLLRHADVAMYVAKATREATAVYTPHSLD